MTSINDIVKSRSKKSTPVDTSVSSSMGFSNPYDGLNVPDPTDYLMGTQSSGYHKELNEYNSQVSAREFESQLALMNDDREYQEHIYNKYNSPSAQVRQMRDAGLNPDVQGVQSSPMQASSKDVSMSSPSMSTSPTYGFAQLGMDVFKMLPQVASMVTGIAGSFQDLQLKGLQIDGLADSQADFDFGNAITASWFDDDGNLKPEIKESFAFYVPSSTNFMNHNGKPTRFQRRYWNSIERLFDGSPERLRERLYTQGGKSADARLGFLNTVGSYGYDMSDNALVGVIRELNKINYEADKATSEDRKTQILARAGKTFKADGMKQINSGNWLAGVFNYLIGMFLDGDIGFSRSLGPKGTSTTFGR